ncbi:MAG: single-stranded-DNA-specific exonuclease RecJ [Clostridia bacterium]|nr:single-stranded-DNA-specific exonuclease RecJ [Clostridia bacterium]
MEELEVRQGEHPTETAQETADGHRHYGRKGKTWSVRYALHGSDDAAVRESEACVREIAEALGVSMITARLLYIRGYRTKEAAEAFIKNDDALLHDPFLMKDMEAAICRVRRAVENGERIVIYGDYDVDGVTSVSMLYLFLRSKGADVSYYIPSRNGEGYGVSCAAIDRLAEKQVSLMITVDTGITANEEVEYAREKGIEVVVTDHHECKSELPRACAVVNPHRPDCTYPFKELAGVGVVFKLLCAYEMTLSRESGQPMIEGVRRVYNEFADLTAIGTIADVMPVRDENRLIVTLGLRMIAATGRKGLAALIEAASATPSSTSKNVTGLPPRIAPKKRKITSGFIGFGLAPRLNAAGRISSATKAVELLLAESDEEARALAEELCEINRTRQVEENRIAEAAYRKIEEGGYLETDRFLVLAADDWQQGIIGIVASRLTERYGMPSILVSFEGAKGGEPSDDDVGKGSGRSVKGINLVEAMGYCEDLLCKFGGHELAAGLTVKRGKIDAFRERINEYVRSRIPEEETCASVEADCEVSIRELTMQLAVELYRLEPYGVSNPTPSFLLRDVTLRKIIPISGGKHMKLVVERAGITFYAMCFNVSSFQFPYSEGERIDLIFTLDINEYRNLRTLQLMVQEVRQSETDRLLLESEKKRLEEIRGGAVFSPEENFLPCRDDVAVVYSYLKSQCRYGHALLSDRMILAAMNLSAPGQVGYGKFFCALDILADLRLCSCERQEDGCYRIEVFKNAAKTPLETSAVLRTLRKQCDTVPR